jgi:uncharacterized repeat protein (TIGR03803 family)
VSSFDRFQRFTTRYWREILVMAIAIAAIDVAHAVGGQLRTVHAFTGTDGGAPIGGLVFDGSRLLGTCEVGGGKDNNGVIFAIEPGGERYEILHQFTYSDGISPGATPLLEGKVLFGTTLNGGNDTNQGTIYSFNIADSAFQVLHAFSGIDGAQSTSGLERVDTRLFGVAKGGSASLGVLFSFDTSANQYQLVHQFPGGPTDGASPLGGVTRVASKLFGTTLMGGDSDRGTVYSVNLVDFTMTVLYEFQPTERGRPSGRLLEHDGRLYGAAGPSSIDEFGVVYSLNPDGSDFRVLHEFSGSDGRDPLSMLITDGQRLYGTTFFGGVAGKGTVFSLGFEGETFRTLHEFTTEDGRHPSGQLLLLDRTLYGTTLFGGPGDGAGTIFSIAVPEPSNLVATMVLLTVLILRFSILTLRFPRTSARATVCRQATAIH